MGAKLTSKSEMQPIMTMNTVIIAMVTKSRFSLHSTTLID